jgi:hypothetical protein
MVGGGQVSRTTLWKLVNLALVGFLVISSIPFTVSRVEAQSCVQIQRVGFDKTPPFSNGDSIEFRVIVANFCSTPQYFLVQCYIDGQLWDSGSISLAGGEATTLSADYLWKASSGNHILKFTAGDSSLSRSFDVTGGPNPPSANCSVSTDKSTYYIGDTITIRVSPTPTQSMGSWLIVRDPNNNESTVNLMSGQSTNTIKASPPAGTYEVQLYNTQGYTNSTGGRVTCSIPCATCNFKVQEKNPPQNEIKVIIVSPKKGDIFYIDSTPKMPTIKCRAQITGISPDPTSITNFFWKANLSYEWHRVDKKITEIAGSQSFPFTQNVIGGTWKPDFGNTIMGGILQIAVVVTINGKKYEDNVSVEIRGENPDKAALKAELRELKYQVLTYKESTWRQFYTTGVDKGLPIFGPPCGYGLMQLDPPPSYREIWDWRANVRGGIEHFNADYKAATGLAAYVKNYYKGKEPVTNLSEEQILRQAYYSYNAGRAYRTKDKNNNYIWWPYYVWDTKKDTWTTNKDRSANGAIYADDAINIFNGNRPKDW